MAVGYQIRDIRNFPGFEEVGQEYKTTSQLALYIAGVDSDNSIYSTIRFLGESSHPDFFRYHVEHETVKPYTVRFDNVRRDSVILLEDFDIYLPKECYLLVGRNYWPKLKRIIEKN